MKKIAVALEEDKKTVSAHFGTCVAYMLYEVDGDKIVTKQEAENPHAGHHGGCMVADFIKSLGASVVITGGMGGKAIQKCENFGIEPVIGHVGDADMLVEAYLRGELQSEGSACSHHGC